MRCSGNWYLFGGGNNLFAWRGQHCCAIWFAQLLLLLGLGCFNRLDVRLFDCALLLLDCRFLLFNEYDLLGLFVYLWLAITHGTPKYIFPVSPYVQMLLSVDLENVQIVKDFNGKASFSLPRYKLKAKIAGSYSQLLIGTVKQQFLIWLTIDVAQAVQQFLVDLFAFGLHRPQAEGWLGKRKLTVVQELFEYAHELNLLVGTSRLRFWKFSGFTTRLR